MTALPADSHTSLRLEHATPDHLHSTTQRLFIGPIPEGWIKSHRKSWYSRYLGDDRSRAPTFTAAREYVAPNREEEHGGATAAEESHGEASEGRPSSQSGGLMVGFSGQGSMTSLLHAHRSSIESTRPADTEAAQGEGAPPEEVERQDSAAPLTPKKVASNLFRPSTRSSKLRVHFDEAHRSELRARAKRAGVAAKGKLRMSKFMEGEILKTDKMLVRVDYTQQTLPDDYDEKAGLGVETKMTDKWREFQVVCRRHTEMDAQAVLQLYQTRVIQAREDDQHKKRPKVEIILRKGSTKVNLFSSLDKMLCVWTTTHGRTAIYYLRAESSATSVEWYTALRFALGFSRAGEVLVNVPELRVSLRLTDPFKAAAQSIEEAAEGDDDDALDKAVADESGAAGAILRRCLDMLQSKEDWREVLKIWAETGRIGLAWKRYDRLEWIYGAVEKRMFGTIAMQRTHELELRPKRHYAQNAKTRKGKTIAEPLPVEGYLIRLTSQQGHERRLGRMNWKRLYFTSQNQFLLFTRPAKSQPPPPPTMLERRKNGSVPSSKQIENSMPTWWNVEPYALDSDGKISWLDEDGVTPVSELVESDRRAADEARRNIDILLSCDGFINLCDVTRVRKMHRGATPADEAIGSGSDIDFDVEVEDSRQDDGATNQVDEERAFELLMRNGLVVRLQAYNTETRDLWMHQLRKLVKYWRARARADINLYKAVRAENLEALRLDERAEAEVGQFAQKWEVTQSQASPEIYNVCGISQCRTVHMSGLLYRKPRRHTTFTRCYCILSSGHLLVFQDTLRRRSGKKLMSIHHERIASLDLRGCYLYSGLLTQNDLLYANQTFDSNAPGHHALPKMYLEDGWHSIDEDANTTFVIWHPKSKSWFKSSETVDDIKDGERDRDKKRTRLKRVSQLGATGQSVVFKARSRAERDHWVLSLQVEIERLAGEGGHGEVRIEGSVNARA